MGNELFDDTMRSYDCTATADLVGLYIPNVLQKDIKEGYI